MSSSLESVPRSIIGRRLDFGNEQNMAHAEQWASRERRSRHRAARRRRRASLDAYIERYPLTEGQMEGLRRQALAEAQQLVELRNAIITEAEARRILGRISRGHVFTPQQSEQNIRRLASMRRGTYRAPETAAQQRHRLYNRAERALQTFPDEARLARNPENRRTLLENVRKLIRDVRNPDDRAFLNEVLHNHLDFLAEDYADQYRY